MHLLGALICHARWALTLLLLLAVVHPAAAQPLAPLAELDDMEPLPNTSMELSPTFSELGILDPIERGQSFEFDYESSQGLIAEFDGGVTFSTVDEEFELRIRPMQQTDLKLSLPIKNRRDWEPTFRAFAHMSKDISRRATNMKCRCKEVLRLPSTYWTRASISIPRMRFKSSSAAFLCRTVTIGSTTSNSTAWRRNVACIP